MSERANSELTVERPLGAGRELDALVAERVMGWSWWEWDAGVGLTRGLLAPNDWRPGRYGYTPSSADSSAKDASEHTVAPFSTSIAAAWLVVEAMETRGWKVVYRTTGPRPGLRRVEVDVPAPELKGPSALYAANADTAPLAICRAALEASPLPPRDERRAETNAHKE